MQGELLACALFVQPMRKGSVVVDPKCHIQQWQVTMEFTFKLTGLVLAVENFQEVVCNSGMLFTTVPMSSHTGSKPPVELCRKSFLFVYLDTVHR